MRRLVKETGIDAWLPLGKCARPYHGEPVWALRNERNQEATNMPLVLHGGTGIPDI